MFISTLLQLSVKMFELNIEINILECFLKGLAVDLALVM